MDTAQGIDSESPDVLREQIEETRASLGQKLETLESEVRSSVQGASNSVKETVDNVKRVFDIRHQVEAHPWMTVGAAFAVGMALGTIATNKPRGASASPRRYYSGESLGTRTRRAGSSTVGWVKRQVQPELEAVKGMATGAAVSFIGDLLKEALPQRFKSRVNPLVASATDKLGGQRVPSSEESRSEGSGMQRQPTGGDGYATGEYADLSQEDRGYAL